MWPVGAKSIRADGQGERQTDRQTDRKRLYINYQLDALIFLFIHKILFSSTCFEPQVLIFRRIQLYTCII